MHLSVIIPTLNEATTLPTTLDLLASRAAHFANVEIIVVDCGSTDRTRDIAARSGVRTVVGPGLTSRARACNGGARAATGDVLLFLHADTCVPMHFDRLIHETIDRPGTIGGAFEFKLNGPEWRLRFVECINRVRYRGRGRFFGDQGIFVLRSAFDVIGGYPDIPILEDAHFCDRAPRFGRMRLVPQPMLTSPRRFYNGGILCTFTLDAVILLWDMLGFDLTPFAKLNRGENSRRAGKRDARPPHTTSRPDRTKPQHPWWTWEHWFPTVG